MSGSSWATARVVVQGKGSLEEGVQHEGCVQDLQGNEECLRVPEQTAGQFVSLTVVTRTTGSGQRANTIPTHGRLLDW